MKKYELEMQIQKQMEELQNQKAEDRNTVEQLCDEWNWALSDKESTVVTNEIIINKGKIVEIKTTEVKEVVINNNDTETIESLKAEIEKYKKEIKNLKEEVERREKIKENFKGVLDANKEYLDRARKENEELKKELKAMKDSKLQIQAEEIIMTDEHNIKHVIGAKGTITIDEKPYVFLANNRHTSPTVFFCMDKKTIDKAETLISKEYFDITFGYLNNECILKDDNVIYDFDNNIVVWKKEDGTFAGYTDKFAFYWDGTSEFVTGKTKEQVYSEAYNPFATTKGNRAMNKSWGRTAALEGQRIKDYLENLKNIVVEEKTIEKPEEIEITEEVVEITIEEQEVEMTEEEMEANFYIPVDEYIIDDETDFDYEDTEDDDDFDDSKAFLF